MTEEVVRDDERDENQEAEKTGMDKLEEAEVHSPNIQRPLGQSLSRVQREAVELERGLEKDTGMQLPA